MESVIEMNTQTKNYPLNVLHNHEYGHEVEILNGTTFSSEEDEPQQQSSEPDEKAREWKVMIELQLLGIDLLFS